MISIVTWLWQEPGTRTYTAAHVNTLAAQFRRRLSSPHRFICVSDSAQGLSAQVEHLKTPIEAQALADLRTPEGTAFPSCYRRLWGFSEAAKVLGDRVLLTDIDAVLVRNIDHLFKRTADFVGYRPKLPFGADSNRIAGGFYLYTPGTNTEVYDDFKGQESIIAARKAGHRGSDQAWLSYKLNGKVPFFNDADGIISIRDIERRFNKKLIPGAAVVQFNGPRKPWQCNFDWVRENWRD